MRAFISFKLPYELIYSLKTTTQNLKQFGTDIRWVTQNNYHITISFYESVTETDFEKIFIKLSETYSELSSIKFSLASIEISPNLHHPRLLWFRLSNETHFQEVYKTGNFVDDNKFKPHITLGRFKSSQNIVNLDSHLQNNYSIDKIDKNIYSINTIEFVKSTISDSGPTYSLLKSIRLK